MTNGPETQPPDGQETALAELGTNVDQVTVDIDNAIISHFSEHLYNSPNKAIEELVSNGFDAFAKNVHVYIPGAYVEDRVVVWDDGGSMDIPSLKNLWLIAKSPKDDGSDRVVTRDGRTRSLIGKFGIGKLASYAIGHRITHLCKVSGRYLAVTVDYRTVPTGRVPGDPGDATAERIKTPIRELLESEMRELAGAQFSQAPQSFDTLFDSDSWTLAVIDLLKGAELKPGRLRWVIGNGMPLRPDFRVFVEETEATPRILKGALQDWKINDPLVVDALRAVWSAARKDGHVQGDLPDPTTDGELTFPKLGTVTASVRLFEESLYKPGSDDARSYGFFILVRGRLINTDDEKFLLDDPNYGTFYRSQFVIDADGLDAELLADRERLRRDTPATRELAAIQRGLFRAARAWLNKNDEETSARERPESRLPTHSRDLFREPIQALLDLLPEGQQPAVNLDDPTIATASMATSDRLGVFDSTSGSLNVNESHPFYQVVKSRAGRGRRADKVMQAFELLAVAEKLTEGHLYAAGVKDDVVEDLFSWRDRLFRALALAYDRNAEDVVLELRAASIPGAARFEDAVAEAFQYMGFIATRDGGSGKKDVLAIAPIGPGEKRFIVEAKGSQEAVGNVTAAVGGAAAHRDAVGATHALIVAREFTGWRNGDEAAILRECRAAKGVSVVQVETLVQLMRAVDEYSYPLSLIADALFEIEEPEAKDERIKHLTNPLDQFNYRLVLEDIWMRQQHESAQDVVPIRTMWQGNPEWRRGMELDDFLNRLVALERLAGGLLRVELPQQNVMMQQSPEVVAHHIQVALGADPVASPPGQQS
ncbi:hypothetical protein GCM10023200_52090 [Actinomycetospora chlora]|uniref:Restriction endonuclease type IV Mrr domain-containing protein n=1 Tax=Actinomycetospora chlora TaxID=663608 RepID=A0ABP9CFE7_9PSEU